MLAPVEALTGPSRIPVGGATAGGEGGDHMSSSISESVDPADGLPVFGTPDAPVDPAVEVTPRPLGEVGVLPLGGEADPIDAADQPVGEVGQVPGIPVEE